MAEGPLVVLGDPRSRPPPAAPRKGCPLRLPPARENRGNRLVPLLADSLTGDALTARFVCVSQAPDNVMQSKIALEFGEVFSKLTVSCHDIIAAIWVAFFSRWQRYRC